MACSYNKDAEIYEQYILDRLSDDEKSDFEAHLSSCETCQNRLEREKWLQANLREIGKREMKTEIRKQVEFQRAEKNYADWGMILRVAAIILFVVLTPGIIYYYQYLAPPPEQNAADKIVVVESEEISAPTADAYSDEDFARRQDLPEQPVLGELKKIEGERKISASARMKKMEIGRAEEIPAETDDLADQAVMEKSISTKDAQEYEDLAGVAPGSGELEKIAGRSRSVAAKAGDEAIYRYDSDQPITADEEKESMYFRSNSSSELEVNQKTWLFRKSAREITMRLQLSDLKPDKQRDLPQNIPAQVIVQDSLRMLIEFQVSQGFYELDPDSVTLYQPNPQMLQIQLPGQVFYEIDLTQKTQQAVQVRP